MANDLMRLSGINSGYDTESMIKAMMSTYQSKIDKQQQKLTKLSWQQDAYRDVTNKLTSFKNKYFDILNRDNYLMSPGTFSKYSTKVSTKSAGDAAKGLSVTTTAASLETSYKVKVDQLATSSTVKGASMTPAGFSLDLEKAAEFSMRSSTGKTDADGNPIEEYSFALDVQVGSVTKSVEFTVEASMKDGVTDMDSFRQSAVESLNKSLQKAFGYSGRKDDAATGQTDADGNEWYIQAKADGNKLTFDVGGNASAVITEKEGNFGLAAASDKAAVSTTSVVTGINTVSVEVNGKTQNVSFMGVSSNYYASKDQPGNEAILKEFNELKAAAYRKENKLGENAPVSQEKLDEFTYTAAQAAKDKNSAAITSALNDAFKDEGVTFSMDSSYLRAKGSDGETAEFSMTSIYGGTLGLVKGSSGNKFTAKTTLEDMGIAANTDDGGYSFTINGERIGLANNATIDDLVSAVNKSGAGVTMTYSALSNSFELTAKDMGSAGQINIEANAITDALGLTRDGSAVNYTQGQNSIIEVNGEKIYHNSNSFATDGTTFNFEEDIELGETYSVGLSKSYDDVKQSIKDFIKDYNQLIDDVYGYTGTAPKRDSKNNLYEPLTDEQKEEMSEDEIEKWETAAKQGILYNDSTVTGIMSKIRTALYGTVEMDNGKNFGLFSMGIKTSSDYKEHGKLELDEAAFDKAFEEHADDIVKLFTDSSSSIMRNVSNIVDNAVRTNSTNKGTLIQKAGLEKGATATDNYIYRQMQSINSRISQLQKRYDSKEEYWWGVFTNLESMMGDLNNQTSYISNYFGSGNYQ